MSYTAVIEAGACRFEVWTQCGRPNCSTYHHKIATCESKADAVKVARLVAPTIGPV